MLLSHTTKNLPRSLLGSFSVTNRSVAKYSFAAAAGSLAADTRIGGLQGGGRGGAHIKSRGICLLGIHKSNNHISNIQMSDTQSRHFSSSLGYSAAHKNKDTSNKSAKRKKNHSKTEEITGSPTDFQRLGFVPVQNITSGDQQPAPENVQQNTEQQTLFEKMSGGNSSYEDYYARMEALEKSGKICVGGGQENVTTAGGSGKGKSGGLKLVDEGESVPAVLKKLEGVNLLSEGEEPWEGVALKWDESGNQGLPDEDEFIALVNAPSGSEVEINDPSEYLSDKQYEQVVHAVREATQGADVRVYRLKVDGVRSEVFVVSREGGGKTARLVGVKALSIES